MARRPRSSLDVQPTETASASDGQHRRVPSEDEYPFGLRQIVVVLDGKDSGAGVRMPEHKIGSRSAGSARSQDSQD